MQRKRLLPFGLMLVMSACGQKGALVLPETAPPPAVETPSQSPANTDQKSDKKDPIQGFEATHS